MQQATARRQTGVMSDTLGVTSQKNRTSALSRSALAHKRKSAMKGRQHPTTGDPDYTADETALLRAILEWRTRSGRSYPTNCELLGLVRGLGYVKVPHGYKLVELSADQMALIPAEMDGGELRPALRVVCPDSAGNEA